jgi:hypothetical protein
MTLSALGIFSAAGAGGVGADTSFDLLETQILGSTQASITFSSLGTYSSTYKHLQIRWVARASRSGQVGDPMVIKINTATPVQTHHLFGTGSSVSSNATTLYAIIDSIAGASAATNQFGVGVIDFVDAFSTTKNKTMRALAGGTGAVSLDSALWNSTTATTSIELIPFSATSFIAGSRFSLYGIKG